ncbi:MULTISPECIES: uroporphyrinogen-III C-methyltransferase [Comamonas]|uniref:uroporphyrinogen-III C-methyltransferase n=1 Tax=Comamonas TaxID=283 RepID=UPI0015FDDA12|nr:MULTISPECIES: uroporphyrinogen-III C-methyltransferase [Comamonas]UUC92435.1 uroporphyrinogen-III C-methyltransferase [Comamonas sp. C11]WEE76454.1 uroporphyrinogen-III C-methyltransferase [Comamonas testosteroni]
MSSDAIPTSDKQPIAPPPSQDHPASAQTGRGAPTALVLTLGAVAAAALVACGMLWQRVGNMQEQLARQSAQSGAQSVEARTLAKDAQDLARDSAARVSVMEARVAELSLQRNQLEELMQSMSRSRDENLVADIESSVRMAQQQAELSGSLQPLVASLKSARKRVESTAQPRLAPVVRAIDLDLDKLSRMSVTDTTGVLSRIEDLIRQVDDLALINDVGRPRARDAQPRKTAAAHDTPEEAGISPTQWIWWQGQGQRVWDSFKDGAADLVRVRRIDHPEVALLAPEQGYFLRENLKLQLLNARLALLSRQWESARADLSAAGTLLNKYFDARSRRTQIAQAQLQQIQANLHAGGRVELEDTLNALTTAAAGR